MRLGSSSRVGQASRPEWLLITATLLTGAAWMLLRAPNLVRAPRYWAEEWHFASAASRMGFWESMAYVYPRAGYYSWPANLGATIGVDLLPLSESPIATTFVSLLIQIAPLIGALFLKFDDEPRAAQRCVLGLALIAATTSGQGIAWLNTLSSQMHLGILAALLLIASPFQARPIGTAATAFALFACGLSGAYAIFMLPAFLLAALYERNRWRMLQAGVLAATLVIQASVVFHTHFVMNRVNEKRGAQSLTWDSFVIGLRESLALPLFGQTAVVGDESTRQLLLALAMGVALISFGALLHSRIATSRQSGPTDLRLLGSIETRGILAWICVVAGICVTSFEGMPAGRYAIVPGALTLLVVWTASIRASSRSLRNLLFAVVLVAACIGMLNPRYPEALDCDGETSGWRTQAAIPITRKSAWIATCPIGWKAKIYAIGHAHDG